MGSTKIRSAAAIALVGALSTAIAFAQGQGPGSRGDPDQRPGMSGGSGMMGGQGMRGGQGTMGDQGMRGGQGMMGGQGMGMAGGVSPYMAGVLGLSDDQREQIESIQREKAREHWQLMQEMRQRRHAMMQLQRQPAPDPDALMEAHERMSEVDGQMLRLQAETQQRIHEVLTEEQRQRLQQMHGGGAQE